jgi:pyruvate kinase
MDVARVNGSHATFDWHSATIDLIRFVDPNTPILLDLPGSKVRTAFLAHEPVLAVGDRLVFTTEPGHDGNDKVSLNNEHVHAYMSPGDRILADDGLLRFEVEEVSGMDIICRSATAGKLGSRKGINLGPVPIPPNSDGRDSEMIRFAKEKGVDFVGVSFVDSVAKIHRVRKMIGGPTPLVLSKIENMGGLDNMEELARESDALMIDRGDLSAETSLESIALFQKRILEVARDAGKPVIVATEMLHSMIRSERPTKAEVTDISNAVLDGAAALMLSGETAIGDFPIQAVSMMRRIADTVSESQQKALDEAGDASVPDAMANAVALICRQLPITKIVAITISGYAARRLAASRLRQPILAVSNDPDTARSLNLLFGTEGVYVDVPFLKTSADHIVSCLEHLWRMAKLVRGDLVLVNSVAYPRSGNRMNIIQTHRIEDLCETQGWQDQA